VSALVAAAIPHQGNYETVSLLIAHEKINAARFGIAGAAAATGRDEPASEEGDFSLEGR
jgi:hypothetical protein